MQPMDHYAVLGLEMGAVAGDIKKAYHRLALETHPDRAGESADIERFKKVSEAYEVLGDPKKKWEYDAVLAQESSSDESIEERPRENEMRRKSFSRTCKRTPSMTPHRSPSFSPRGSAQPLPQQKFCRAEVVIISLLATLFILLASSRGGYIRSPALQTTISHQPGSHLSPTRPGVTITGACPASKRVIEGEYIAIGTLLGRPWYRQKTYGSMLYYDSACDGTSRSPSGWFIMDAEKADQVVPAPTFGTGCGTTARIAWDGSQLPFGTETWEMACADSTPTKVNLTITKIGGYTQWG
eukprot:TRINITY_DN124_c2_g1_i1.p1 TRINITY_DN124_c2_g1~~TRINITY_DN124_c2_g1_i1.p1  ORF type:complete len:297 (+),score=24.40 TRINITY_DN124_c2_g1_i1:86-976(+)